MQPNIDFKQNQEDWAGENQEKSHISKYIGQGSDFLRLLFRRAFSTGHCGTALPSSSSSRQAASANLMTSLQGSSWRPPWQCFQWYLGSTLQKAGWSYYCWVMMFFNGDIITYHKRVRIPVHNAFKLASRVAPQPYRHANLRALCEGPGQGQREEMTSKKWYSISVSSVYIYMNICVCVHVYWCRIF